MRRVSFLALLLATLLPTLPPDPGGDRPTSHIRVHRPGAVPADTSPRAVVLRWFAAAQADDVGAMLALLHEQAVYEDVPFEYRVQGTAAIGDMLRGALAALRPVERRLLRVVADGERVAVEWEAEGTHAAPVLGVAPTGRRIRLRVASFVEVRGGRIVRVTDYTDRAGLERQLRE